MTKQEIIKALYEIKARNKFEKSEAIEIMALYEACNEHCPPDLSLIMEVTVAIPNIWLPGTDFVDDMRTIYMKVQKPAFENWFKNISENERYRLVQETLAMKRVVMYGQC